MHPNPGIPPRSHRGPGLRRTARLALPLILSVLGGLRETAAAQSPAEPAVIRAATTGIPEWTPIDSRVLLRDPANRWTLHLEETLSGTALSNGRETPIRQTRVRFALQRPEEGDEVDIGYLQHLGNLEVAVLEPGDPRLDEAPTVRNDPDDPWPNPTSFHFVELERAVDVDDDDRNEAFLRFSSTVDHPEARGLLVIGENEFGAPRILDLSEFVSGVRTEGLFLTDLTWPDRRMRDPVLEARFLPNEACRFLALLEIRGESQCDDCCALPVFLNRAGDRSFRPFFDRAVHTPALDRIRRDIALIQSGQEADDLPSGDQAALARVAAFFYLTGSGAQSRINLEKALGPRADQYKARLLLDRIEDYFLAERTVSFSTDQ